MLPNPSTHKQPITRTVQHQSKQTDYLKPQFYESIEESENEQEIKGSEFIEADNLEVQQYIRQCNYCKTKLRANHHSQKMTCKCGLSFCSNCEQARSGKHKCESERRNQQRQEIRRIDEKRRIIEDRKNNFRKLAPFIAVCVLLTLFDILAAFSPSVCGLIPIDLRIMVITLNQWFIIDSSICFLFVIMFGMGVIIPENSKCFILLMCYAVLVFGLKIFWVIIQTSLFVSGVQSQQMGCKWSPALVYLRGYTIALYLAYCCFGLIASLKRN